MQNSLNHLIENNRKWVAGITARNPGFFKKLESQQHPQYMWIGCCDSRVPANEIIGLMPGEVFVHRNVANVVLSNDLNCMSAVQYAVEVLGIRHIIICGHYGCGGVNASMEDIAHGLIDYWVWPIKQLQRKHPWLSDLAKSNAQDALCELNVVEQVSNVAECKVLRRAWSEGIEVEVHGWIYDVGDGCLRDLGVRLDRGTEVRERIDAAEVSIRNQALGS